MLQLRYFAGLRESLGIADEQFALQDDVRTVADLTDCLRQRSEAWDSALSSKYLNVAVNQEIVTTDTAVNDGDEVAWFPPVTGG